MNMSKLKHSDDYKGKIKRENERFSDRRKSKESPIKSDYGSEKSLNRKRLKQNASKNQSLREEKNLEEVKTENLPLDKEREPCDESLSFHERMVLLKQKRKQAEQFRGNEAKNIIGNQNEEGDGKNSKNQIEEENSTQTKDTSKEQISRVTRNVNPRNSETESKRSCGNEEVKRNKRDKREETPLSENGEKEKSFGKLNSSNIQKLSNSALLSLEKSAKLTRDYLSTGRENSGVESGEKTADAVSKLSHGIRDYSRKKQKFSEFLKDKKDLKQRKKKSKLEFKETKKDLKVDPNYQKMSRLKQFQKKKQMKNTIYKNHQVRVRDRMKKGIFQVANALKQFIFRRAKIAIGLILAIVILGTFIIQFSNTSMSMLSNSTTSVAATSYLSDERVLDDINQSFGSLEQELQDEIDSVESNFPGYDEYIINKNGEIGHNVHELLSYITARYGEAKDVSEVSSILKNLFDEMYSLKYKEEIEIRTRIVEYTFIDENGNEQTGTREEQYKYKKLIVTLDKKAMDSVVRGIFSGYSDNLTHYEALLETGGNMGEVFGSKDGNLSEIVENPNFGNPGIAFNEERVKQLFAEAEKHIGKRYVFGGDGPSNFDCSSFVCWSYTHSGVKNMPRTTAYRIYKDYCNPISPREAKAGDIIFFKNTYNSGSPISHVGIYAGNGMMLHAGDPIKFVSIDTPYWREHFYGFGRIKD